MDEWLLHMTEEQRLYAVDLIDAMLVALDKPVHASIPRWANTTTVSVHSLPDRRPGASVSLSRGNVILRTPMSPRRLKFAAEIVGPSCIPTDAFPSADGEVATMRATLAGWRNALSSPVTDAANAKVRNMRSAITTLLRGAAHAHRPDWEMAALDSSRDEGHAVKVFHREPDGRQVQSRFAVRTSSNTDGAMTQALVDEIDRILGNSAHAHVVELDRWQRYRLRFHSTPTYCLSPTRDAMLTLRAFNALPAGAQLVLTEKWKRPRWS